MSQSELGYLTNTIEEEHKKVEAGLKKYSIYNLLGVFAFIFTITAAKTAGPIIATVVLLATPALFIYSWFKKVTGRKKFYSWVSGLVLGYALKKINSDLKVHSEIGDDKLMLGKQKYIMYPPWVSQSYIYHSFPKAEATRNGLNVAIIISETTGRKKVGDPGYIPRYNGCFLIVTSIEASNKLDEKEIMTSDYQLAKKKLLDREEFEKEEHFKSEGQIISYFALSKPILQVKKKKLPYEEDIDHAAEILIDLVKTLDIMADNLKEN